MLVDDWLKTPIVKNRLAWEKVGKMDIDLSHHLHQEPLVRVVPTARIRVYSAYYHDGISGALESIYLRQSVLERLEQLVDRLPENLGLLLLDGWRPVAVQESLRHNFREDLERSYPDFNHAQIEDLLDQFVAKPSANPLAPSPHLTGGSIDLTLFDLSTESEIDMGTSFDAMEEASWSHYFEENAHDALEKQIRDHRRLLINGMAAVGFSNLPSEWWHFDFGNQLWGYYQKERAFYGIASLLAQ
ncbi:M15 family metallopeptidase [Ignatzschineria cameli]|uniref:D-alanyl-D-alanine dipeptidase n=1 Tax=Ignatzschineria cameli TaxID=2182793 RepID=A0A2U2ASN3_9GAMM|nr:M15 family metallopeptidase [Ignatzschineria cameli]PWD86062.1 D-alanyl-D-alanine dipeptidase [Ignatzschineria cameli]PWD87722.1 D-alanyl-D-alanine dipeptidase [Ignatzschineria cameli]PWD88505.1 D-alanyl-D-alanine dipeptidase [Ignatzschineria cameli]PWD89126.1 D-alanyl-D-alanine dipeptidase [Ignatzschineria cameli]PWD89974.1 D-alanyl-D-alanine dipeptidase [Ignatzschineria cameli]